MIEWLSQEPSPDAFAHPVRALIQLLAELRYERMGQLRPLMRLPDGTLPTREKQEEGWDIGTEVDCWLAPKSHLITSLVRDARFACGTANLDPFRVDEILNLTQSALWTLWTFPKLVQRVSGFRAELSQNPPRELVEAARPHPGADPEPSLEFDLDNLAVGRFLGEDFDPPYDRLLALWDNLAGRDAVFLTVASGNATDGGPKASETPVVIRTPDTPASQEPLPDGWEEHCGGRLLAAPQFATVRRTADGAVFTLKTKARLVVKYMAEVFTRGRRTSFTGGELLKAAGSDAAEVRSLFRSNGEEHSGWKDLVKKVDGEDDRYTLNLKGETQPR